MNKSTKMFVFLLTQMILIVKLAMVLKEIYYFANLFGGVWRCHQ
jgi:hypothetical protein